VAFSVDHVWIVAAEGEELAAAFAAATGLPMLVGWSPDGFTRSRGVRFANGPFLDIHDGPADAARPALLIGGRLAEAERLAATHGWRLKLNRRADAPSGEAAPWSMGFFRRDQGVLSHLGLIDYEIDPAGCGEPEYAVPLFALNSAPTAGARLEAVWLGVAGDADPTADLDALGFVPQGEVRGGGRSGLRFAHPTCDLVLCAGLGVVRLDVSGAPAQGELKLGPLELALH